MIIFKGVRGENSGIYISSLYDSEITVLCKIIDGYSGLCSYATHMRLTPGVTYFFDHFVRIFHRRFEVWSEDEKELYLKIDIQSDSSPKVDLYDVYGKLKNFKYDNKKDFDAALPLYEIFINDLYNKSHCKINTNDVVVDIGGNLGFFSYFALCRDASKVYCFEPSKECVETIKNNFDFSNLIIEESAVTKHNGGVIFYYNENSSIQSSIYTPELGNGIACKSTNLMEYIEDNYIEKINFLKIDCEGSEYEIIDCLSEEYLSNNIDKMCIEFHHNTGKLDQMLSKIKKCGFNVESEGGSSIIQGELGVFYAWKN
jgi:FkbM family methyltransferase